MKTRLIFERKGCETEEYIVKNRRGDFLGDIAYWKIKGHRKKDWWFFVSWNPMDDERDFWIGEDCLREIADFLNKLKKRK